MYLCILMHSCRLSNHVPGPVVSPGSLVRSKSIRVVRGKSLRSRGKRKCTKLGAAGDIFWVLSPRWSSSANRYVNRM